MRRVTDPSNSSGFPPLRVTRTFTAITPCVSQEIGQRSSFSLVYELPTPQGTTVKCNSKVSIL